MESSSNPYIGDIEEGKVNKIEEGRTPPLYSKHTHFLSASNLNTPIAEKLIHFKEKPESKIINLKNMKFFHAHHTPRHMPKASLLSRHFSQTSHQGEFHRYKTANESTQSYNFQYRQMRNHTPEQSVKENPRQAISFFSSHLNTVPSPKRSDDNVAQQPSFHHPVLRAAQRLHYNSYSLPPLRIIKPTLQFSLLKKLYFVVCLSKIGIEDERAERALFVREIGKFEELLAYIFEDESEKKFMHRFQAQLKGALVPQERCDICEKKQRLMKGTEPGSPQFKRLPTANLFFCGDQVLINNERMEKIIEMQEMQSEQSVPAASFLRTQLSRALSIRSLDPKSQQQQVFVPSLQASIKLAQPSELEISRSPSKTKLKALIFPSSDVEDTLPRQEEVPKIEETQIVRASVGTFQFLPIPEPLYIQAGSHASSQSILPEQPERMIESPRQLVKPPSSTITKEQDELYCAICGETEEMHSADYNFSLTLKEDIACTQSPGAMKHYRSSSHNLLAPFHVSHNVEGSEFELIIRDRRSHNFDDSQLEGLCTICYEFKLSNETDCCKFPLCNQCKHKLGDSSLFCPFCGVHTTEQLDQVMVVSEKVLLEEYNKIGEGRWIQFCPRCYMVVMRAHRCHNHLYCSNCELQFCLYCRQKFTKSHFNPFSKSPCKHLRIHKVPGSSSAIKQATVVSEALVRFNKSRKKKCLITLLMLLLSPILSLFVLPYYLASEVRFHSRYSKIRAEIKQNLKKISNQTQSSAKDICGKRPR